MRVAIISDAVLETPSASGHGLGKMVSQVAEGLLARGHDCTLFARQGSSFSGPLVMPDDATGYAGEVALAREVMRHHRGWSFDAILDSSHIHKIADLLPDMPCVSAFHDIYQNYQRCAVVMSFGQKTLMPPQFHKARIIPNALNPADFPIGMAPAVPPYAFWCGAIADIKAPILAIEACARFGIKLVMAGAPLAGKIPFTEHSNVEYVGPVDAQTRNRLMAHARFFLQLGPVESFGLTTLEAMLCACPVVGWPAGGTLDLIRDGVNGVFVPLTGSDIVQNVADAMERAFWMDREMVRAYSQQLTSIERQLDGYEQACIDVVRGEWW